MRFLVAYSPYQNAKQETFWATVEGRLMVMLEGLTELTLGNVGHLSTVWNAAIAP